MSALLQSPILKQADVRLATTHLHFKNILLATDFSSGSESALLAAAEVARFFHSHLDIINVTVPGVYPTITGGEQLVMDVQIESSRARMMDFVRTPALDGIETNVEVVWGASIIDRLNEAIREKHSDLVVVSSHGATGIERMLLGSVAEAIMRHVGCPVMVVGPNVRPGALNWNSILLATDLSYQSLRAAQYATALAEEAKSNLTLLHVVENGDRIHNAPANVFAELEQLLPEDARRRCQPRFRVEYGEISDRVLAAADLDQAGLIVMATKDRGMMADHAPWSHFSHIVHGAYCPVLAVQKHL